MDLLSTLDPGVGASEPESTTLCSRMQAALQRTPSNSDTAMLTSSTVPERDPIDRLTSGSLGTVGTPENLTGSSTAGRNSNASRRKPPPVQAGDGVAEAGPSGLSAAAQKKRKKGNVWVACTVAGSFAAGRNSSASRLELFLHAEKAERPSLPSGLYPNDFNSGDKLRKPREKKAPKKQSKSCMYTGCKSGWEVPSNQEQKCPSRARASWHVSFSILHALNSSCTHAGVVSSPGAKELIIVNRD